MDESDPRVMVVLGPAPDTNAAVMERMITNLRAELLLLALNSVDRAAETAPDRSKSGGAFAIGTLLIAMSASGAVFTELVGTLRDWLGRQSGGHSITVIRGTETITIVAATASQQRQLIDDFRQRNTTGG